jgi:hypothetical protein
MKPKKLAGTYKDADNLCLASTEPGEPPIAQLNDSKFLATRVAPCDFY